MNSMLRNPEAEAFFAPLSAHSDVASAFVDALRKLGDYGVHAAPREYGALFAVTADVVFAGAAGMASTYWRLSTADRAVALATGATEAAALGPEWVEITLFRDGWPDPDLRHWALCAYRYARTSR
jgi:hypothetical protein